MKKFFAWIIIIISFLNCAEKDDEQLTLIVGSRRTIGPVDEKVKRQLLTIDVDFSHLKSFSGVVGTVDVGAPCAIENLPPEHFHMQRNFFELRAEELPKRPNRIMFEWFPSNDNRSAANHLLKNAVVRAHELLAPGGELIIDHFPYFILLMGHTEKEAREYFKATCTGTAAYKELSDFVKGLVTDGVKVDDIDCARKWQTIDPFSFCIGKKELSEILPKMLSLFEGTANKKDFITQVIERSCQRIATTSEYMKRWSFNDLIGAINNDLLFFRDRKQSDFELGETSMFLWFYYMETRSGLIRENLTKIGFSDIGMKYYEKNPFNGRNHAWIVRAKKAK